MGSTDINDISASDLMSRHPIIAGPNEDLSEALGRMREKDVHEIFVVEDGKLLGMVSYDSLIRRRGLPPTTRVGHVMDHVAHIDENCKLPRIAETMLATGLRALPVKRDEDFIGVVSRTDLVSSILQFPQLAKTPVESVMSPSVTSVYGNDSVSRARHIMRDLDARSIPVIDEYGRLVGMVGEKDIGALVIHSQRRGEDAGLDAGPLDVKVESVMRSPPVCVGKDATVRDVIDLMKKYDISNIIVEEKMVPHGIVTQIDLVELLVAHGREQEAYVQITGLEEGPEVYEEMYEAIGKTLKRIAKVANPRVVNLHIVRHQTRGDRFKHSIRARLATERGMYYAKASDWNLFSTLDEVLDQLERDAKRDKEKRLDARKRKIRS